MMARDYGLDIRNMKRKWFGKGFEPVALSPNLAFLLLCYVPSHQMVTPLGIEWLGASLTWSLLKSFGEKIIHLNT